MEKITLTEEAAKRIHSFLEHEPEKIGLRFGVTKTGCNGYAYVVNLADEVSANDQVFEDKDIKIVVNVESLDFLKGTQIGENSIIGAGSVVHGDIPPNSVYAGNPAKEVKKLDKGSFVTREELFNDSSTYLQDLNIIEENMLGNNSFLGWIKSMFWPKK